MFVDVIRDFNLTLYVTPVLLVSTIILAVGLFIAVQNIRSPVNFSFFLICFSVCVWFYSMGIIYGLHSAELALSVYRTITFFGVSFISPFVYIFSAIWFGRSKEQSRGIIFGLAGGAVFYLIGLLTPYGFDGIRRYYWGFYPIYGLSGKIFLFFFFGYFFAAFYNYIRGYRNESLPLRKKQIKLIAIAFLFSFTGSVDYIPKLFNFAIYPIGYISVLIWILMVAYTIVRYKAMDIETVVHKTLMWLATTIVAILPFFILTYVFKDLLQRISGVWLGVIVTAQTLIFYAYFSKLQPVLSQLFRRRHADLQTAYQRFSDDLVHLKDLRSLLQRIMRLIRRTLYIKQASLYMADAAGEMLVPVIVKGMRGVKPVELSHPFLTWLKMKDRVVLLDFTQDDPTASDVKPHMIEYFSDRNTLVAVPLVLGGNLLGVLHLGRKENLQRFKSSEVQFLTQLKAPMTIALSNSLQFENVSKLYEQVQVQNTRLKELDRLKSQFLANTSHELRTPLNGILGLVEAVLDGADGEVNPAQSRHLRMILESGANLKELINNLLELSKLESGQTHLNIKPFNILNAVTVVLALLEGIAHKKGVQLKCESEKDLPDVFGDPEKIQRVLLNLAGNALKFTEKGSVTIRLQKHEGCVSVSVEDTGIGIKENDLKVIFERFRQADGGETRNYEGTGLGLSIARDIVRLHQSDISVTSQFGQGSIFSFEMLTALFQQAALNVPVETAGAAAETAPIVKDVESVSAEAPQEKIYELSQDFDEGAIVRGNEELVLVVDDNEVNREVIRTRLGMNNYRVVEAVDGQEALDKVASDKPAIVLLDLMMPRMSGYEFCKQVRKEYSADELPIIMLTAKTEMGDKVFGLNIGANDYLSKPFHQEELLARVGVLLRLRAMHEQLRGWNTQLEVRVEERTRELHATQTQLIQAEKMATVGTFAGGIAHEINNPLTAVLTNAQVLKMTSVNEEDKELVDLIEEGAKRCQVIIQKLMKYSRKADINSARQALSLESVVQSVCGLLAYQLQQDNVAIEQDLAGLPAIQGNAGELEQVFTNMILNAKDAILSTGRGEGLIRLQGRRTGDQIRVEVIDNGTGIKKENLTKIFDPFFTTKDVGSGTGLGLSVTHGILERHACRVFVESEWGVGTTFVLVFPLGN